MATHYELLGVAPDATLIDIKKAYRQLARQYHPDTGQTTDALHFLEISEAYQTLIDEDLRAVYDRQLNTQNARDVYNAARDMVAQQSAHRNSRHELRPFYWILIGFVIFFFIMLIALAIIMLEYGPERVRVETEPNSVNWMIEVVYVSYV